MATLDPITARLDDLHDRVSEIVQAQREDAAALRGAHAETTRALTAEIRSVGDLVRLQGERTSAVETKVAVLEERGSSMKTKAAPWLSLTAIISMLVEIIRHLVMSGPTLPTK